MTSIDRASAPNAIAATAETQSAFDARAVAGAAIGEIGHRVLAWSGVASGHTPASAAWSDGTGAAQGFRPDPAELARGGDVYDLRGLAADIGARFGASPAEEGTLLRAVEDLTRAVAVQVHALAGGGDTQVAGARAAFGDALAATAPEGVDGVIARLEVATRTLEQQTQV